MPASLASPVGSSPAVRWATPVAVGVVAMLSMAFAMLTLMAEEGFGPSTFVIAGSEFVDQTQTPAELLVYPDTVGYDGQQFYRLSRHPLSTEPVVEGIALDDGPYRQQRIVYPLTAWGAAAATGLSTLVTLPLLNLLCVGAMAGLMATWARRNGRSPWLGVVVGMLPPLYFGATRNLSEPLALVLMVVGIMLWQRRPWWGACVLTLAVLTRETTIVAAAGFGVVALVSWWQTRSWRPLREQGLPALTPLVALLAWQSYLGRAWGAPAAGGNTARIRAPSLEFFSSMADVDPALARPPWVQYLWSIEQLVLLVVLGVAVWLAWTQRDVLPALRISLVLAIAVPLLSAGQGWAWAGAFTRAAGEAMILGAMVALCAGQRCRWFFWPVAILIPLVVISG